MMELFRRGEVLPEGRTNEEQERLAEGRGFPTEGKKGTKEKGRMERTGRMDRYGG